MPRFYSPLRYPGGKSSFLKYFADIIDSNGPIDTYIEPFAGGAGLALGLLLNGYVKRIILNDADEFIFKFWKSLLTRKSLLVERIQDTPVTMLNYYDQKEFLLNDSKRKRASDIQIGFSALYINRCNRSGILNSGPIGGYDQSGVWKLDARFNKADLIKRIEHIYEYRDSISIYNDKAIHFLRDILPNIAPDFKRTLIYLDPPYYEQGKNLYRKFYKNIEHYKLKDHLSNETNYKWILSYDDVPQINKLYAGTKINGYKKSHFANKAKLGKELIIVSDNCILPITKNEQ